jgi:hypothetical protein
MALGWKRLIPLALGWLLVLAGMRVDWRYGFAIFGGGVLAGAVLFRSLEVGRHSAEVETAQQGGVRN